MACGRLLFGDDGVTLTQRPYPVLQFHSAKKIEHAEKFPADET